MILNRIQQLRRLLFYFRQTLLSTKETKENINKETKRKTNLFKVML